MKLEDLLSNGTIQYGKTLHINKSASRCQEYIKEVQTKDGKKGINSVILEQEDEDLPSISIKTLLPMEYKQIYSFANFKTITCWDHRLYVFRFDTSDGYEEIKLLSGDKPSVFIDAITKKEKFKRIKCFGAPNFYLLGETEDKKYSLFEIDIVKDNDFQDSVKIKYILKNCEYAISSSNYGNFYLIKNSKDRVQIMDYSQGRFIKKVYSGNLISKNERYFVVKDKNKFTIFSFENSEPLATYTNDDIIDMQLCPYDDDLCPKTHEVVILTTKENNKKLLSITVKNENFSFIENNELFDELSYHFCWIPIEAEESYEYDLGFSFNGKRAEEDYHVNVKPDGNVETIRKKSNDGPVLTLKKSC